MAINIILANLMVMINYIRLIYIIRYYLGL